MGAEAPMQRRHGMRHSRTQRQAALGAVVVLALLMATVATVGAFAKPSTAFACPSITGAARGATCATTWPYGHSWYIKNVGNVTCTINGVQAKNVPAMRCLAYNDAQQVNSECANNTNGTDFMTVLDFGRPGLTSSGYSLFSSYFGWRTYGQVETYAEQYADAWFNYTTSCPRLHLVIGTANDYECYSTVNGCNTYTAGQQFDVTAHVIQSHLNGEGYSWQETVWLGDDVEAEWDEWSTTSSFLNGVYAQEKTYSSPHAYLIDYGDANIDWPDFAGHYWTYQDIYDAAWGIGYDEPLPQIYGNTSGPGNITQWVNMYTSGSVNRYAGQVVFEGNMAECPQADPLPTGNCWSSFGRWEYSPEAGYLLLANDVNQQNMPYTTNIQYQCSQPNQGCS
jgi:hypothetical protein